MKHKYTLGTTPNDVIIHELPHKYEMLLNKTDMLNLILSLRITAGLETPSESLQDWAMEFMSNILETLNIEEI